MPRKTRAKSRAKPRAAKPRAKPATHSKLADLTGMMASRSDRLKILTDVIKYANELLSKAKREKNASDIAFFTEKIETAREFYRHIYAVKPGTSWSVMQRMPHSTANQPRH